MRILLGIVIVGTAAWFYWRWRWENQGAEERQEAEYYTSLLNHHAQQCARHLQAARDSDRAWEERMERLNRAQEAKETHAETLLEAPPDMRGQDPDHPPRSDFSSLRQDLFEPRKGDPDLPWHVLRDEEKASHARELEQVAAHHRSESDEERAGEIEEVVEAIYWDLIAREYRGSVPYWRLALMYRERKEYEREAKVLQLGLDRARLQPEEERHRFEERLERTRELRAGV